MASRRGAILGASSIQTGVALRWNSVFVFVASAASFGFYMSAVSSRFSHLPQSSSLLSYDVGDSRERSSDRSRLHRGRAATAAAQTTLGKRRVSSPVRAEAALRTDRHGETEDNSFVNLMIHALALPPASP